MVCTVYAIDTINGWYYIACAVCSNKVFKQAIIFDEVDVPSWWCEFCQNNVTKVSPRLFAIHNFFLFVKYFFYENESYSLPFLLKFDFSGISWNCLCRIRPVRLKSHF